MTDLHEMKQAAEAGKWGELKRLAEAATPGPWEAQPGYAIVRQAHPGMGSICGALIQEDAKFIAASHPAAVLELIAENERLRADLSGEMDHARDFNIEHEELKHERDQLKAENDRFRELMAAVAREKPRSLSYPPGNAPGHSHAIPGVWDSDNGDKAGTECGWCKVWNAAMAMAKEARP